MVCYIESPPSETFALTVARVSFNGSDSGNLDEINNNNVPPIDLSRYSANVDGLTLTAARVGIRLVIESYLPSDSATVFGCHGTFLNSSVSDSLVSGMPNEQAG